MNFIAEYAAPLRILRVAENMEILWGKQYPDVNLVTTRVSSDTWCKLDFPIAPAVDDVSCTGE
jgi:hypothetical protein